MTATSNRRGFGFSFGTLQRDAQRLLEALQDNTIGAPVVTRLPATFVADFTAQIALAAKLGTDKSGAIGSLGTLTLAQAQAVANYAGLAAIARRAAKLAFSAQDTLLHSAFMVGAKEPRALAGYLDQARAFVAACQKYSADLAPYGWPDTDNAELAAAFTALTTAGKDQGAASGVKMGTTAQRTDAANALYKQCLTVQNAASKVYSQAQVAADASLVEGRVRFLLGEFPPRFRASVKTPAAPTTAASPATPAVPAAAPVVPVAHPLAA